MRKLILPLFIILFLGLGYYFFLIKATSSTDSKNEASAEALADKNQKPSDKLNSGDVTTAQISSRDQSTAPVNSALISETEKEKLQKWILEESKNLNQPHVDTKLKDVELKKIVENYSDAQKKVILENALDTTKTANERILSSYLLGLDQSQQSIQNLGALAQKKLPDFGPVIPHSEAEIRRGQELAVRYMAIDELSQRAQTDPKALEALKKQAVDAESSEVRNYAQRILKEIK
jgi:hypothetical protein